MVTDALQLGARGGPVFMSSFGCQANVNVDLSPGTGLLSLGNDPSSTFSQLVARGFIDPAFSFCLGGGKASEQGSRLVFGRTAPQPRTRYQSANLTAPPGAEDLFNVRVATLRAGSAVIQVDAAFAIDTGTTAVGLPPRTLAALAAHWKASLPAWIEFLPADSEANDLLCFGALRPASFKQFAAAFPAVAVDLGGGASVDWVPKHYLALLDAGNNPATGPAYCALVFGTDPQLDFPPGILGASFLQNLHTMIDLPAGTARFASVPSCAGLRDV